MKIGVVTICRNEEIIMPFFLRHYCFADQVHIFDAGSTDKCLEIARRDSRAVLHNLDSCGEFRDDLNMTVKNEFYKGLDVDWVVIVDMDEFLYYPNIMGLLDKYVATGVTLPKTKAYQMVGSEVPKDDGSTPLTRIQKMGCNPAERTPAHDESAICKRYLDSNFSKNAIFRSQLVDIRYGIGAHYCAPVGIVKESENADILLLHYAFLSRQYFIDKHNSYKISEDNIRRGAGWVWDKETNTKHMGETYDILSRNSKQVIGN
jgi:hypothetical protein